MKWGDWRSAVSRPSTPPNLKGRSKTLRVAREISEYLLVFAVLFIIFSLVGMGTSFGDEGAVPPVLPTARVYPSPGGILFPGFNVAAGVNAAALPLLARGTALQGAITPPLQSGDPTSLFGALASSNGKLGGGFGYQGTKSPGAAMTHGIFAGGAYAFHPVSLGAQLRDADLSGGAGPSLDLGVVVGQGHGLEFGGVFYDLNHSARAGVGVGYGEKQYNLEANVLLPPFSTFDSGYVLTGAVNVMAGIVGAHARVSYLTAPSSWSETFGADVWVSRRLSLLLQFTTSRTLTAGLTLLL